MHHHSSNLNHNNSIMNGIGLDLDIDLELYCCKFYDEDIKVKHIYFLIIPADKHNTTINVNFQLDAQPTNETVKQWLNQPWYHHSVIEKYHFIQPKNSLPVSNRNPFKWLWTKWAKKGENVPYPAFMYFHHDEE